MIEVDRLQEAQEFITRELQRQSTDRIDAADWQQTPQDRATRVYRLVVFRSGEKSIFTFTEYELLENYGSKEWEKQLRDHCSDILTEFRDVRENGEA